MGSEMCIRDSINAIRPLEVTVINQKDVVPWKFPPKHEFMYGEWLREQFLTSQPLLLAKARPQL